MHRRSMRPDLCPARGPPHASGFRSLVAARNRTMGRSASPGFLFRRFFLHGTRPALDLSRAVGADLLPLLSLWRIHDALLAWCDLLCWNRCVAAAQRWSRCQRACSDRGAVDRKSHPAPRRDVHDFSIRSIPGVVVETLSNRQSSPLAAALVDASVGESASGVHRGPGALPDLFGPRKHAADFRQRASTSVRAPSSCMAMAGSDLSGHSCQSVGAIVLHSVVAAAKRTGSAQLMDRGVGGHSALMGQPASSHQLA